MFFLAVIASGGHTLLVLHLPCCGSTFSVELCTPTRIVHRVRIIPDRVGLWKMTKRGVSEFTSHAGLARYGLIVTSACVSHAIHDRYPDEDDS